MVREDPEDERTRSLPSRRFSRGEREILAEALERLDEPAREILRLRARGNGWDAVGRAIGTDGAAARKRLLNAIAAVSPEIARRRRERKGST